MGWINDTTGDNCPVGKQVYSWSHYNPFNTKQQARIASVTLCLNTLFVWRSTGVWWGRVGRTTCEKQRNNCKSISKRSFSGMKRPFWIITVINWIAWQYNEATFGCFCQAYSSWAIETAFSSWLTW